MDSASELIHDIGVVNLILHRLNPISIHRILNLLLIYFKILQGTRARLFSVVDERFPFRRFIIIVFIILFQLDLDGSRTPFRAHLRTSTALSFLPTTLDKEAFLAVGSLHHAGFHNRLVIDASKHFVGAAFVKFTGSFCRVIKPLPNLLKESHLLRFFLILLFLSGPEVFTLFSILTEAIDLGY